MCCSFKMLEGGTLNCLAISGPTWDQQSPFQWSTSPFANVTHLVSHYGTCSLNFVNDGLLAAVAFPCSLCT